MKLNYAKLALALSSAILLSLAGCGSDADVTSTTSTPTAPTAPPPAAASAITLTGTAATGAAFVDAVITVIDSTGAVVGTSSPVGTDGKYTVTLKDGAKPPFVLVASRTTADGQVQSLVSVVESATATTANVTPITNLIASRLSPSGDPTKLAAELAAGTTQITPATVAATVAEVKTILATLLEATGTSGTDPLTGTFTVDGTGYDRLLDSISINIVPASAASSNIEIAVKQQLPDGTQPATVSFASASTSPPALPPVSATTLVVEGTSVKISNFLNALTACYAVPFAERVNGVTGSVTSVSGTAVDVIAPACRTVFSGNDPATFKSNGRVVSSTGAFSGLFRAGATGAVFSQGTYEFTRVNGDLVIGYKSRGTDGSETFDTFAVRNDTTDGKLKLIGNQYNYPGGVNAYQQYRQFVTLGQSAYSYRSTGYTLQVDDVKDGTGVTIFDRVEVTSPKGNILTLKPSAGSSWLPLVKSVNPLGTNFVRLRSEFDNSATTGDLALIEPNLFFSSTPYSDADIAAIPSQAVWSFKYFFKGSYLAANPGVTDGLVQTYKTRARPMTIAELKTRSLAQLTDQDLAEINAQAVPKGIDFAGAPDAVAHWTVPTGALPPTSITFFGTLWDTSTTPSSTWVKLQGFNDSASFSSTLRASPVVPCSAPVGDLHCSATPVAGSYAAGAYVNGMHLWARDATGREFASFYAMYQLTLPAP